jgi:hypothetical protein
MRKKLTHLQAKKRGQKLYERMFANARLYRWKIVAQHAISMMATGKPLFHGEAQDLIRVRDADKKRQAEIENSVTQSKLQQIATAEAASLFRTPVSEPSPTTAVPSGSDYSYNHHDYFDMYRHRDVPKGPTDSGSEPPPQHPQD